MNQMPSAFDSLPHHTCIALISDTHTTRGTLLDQPHYKARFERVIRAVNAASPDWVLHAGDLTEDATPAEISDFQEQIQAVEAPLDWVFGNHDVGSKRVDGISADLSAGRIERVEATLGSSFWDKTRSGVRVVAANASLFNSDLPREKEQWDFLETAFHSPSPTPTLFLLHYPLFIASFDEPDDPYWNIAPSPRQRLYRLLEKGGVQAVLSGHLHRPLSLQHRHIHFIGAHPVSFALPQVRQALGWTEITFASNGELSWRRHYIGE